MEMRKWIYLVPFWSVPGGSTLHYFNIKNWTYYFYNGQIDLKDFDASLLKIDKKDYKDIDIYYIGYVTVKKIANCNNINSADPLHLMINNMIGHFEEKKWE